MEIRGLLYSFLPLSFCSLLLKAKGSWTLILQGKTVFVDQEGSAWGNQQAIFTVYRGRMLEGYDFRDDLCRMAICKS
jgi:hypothetical protein